MHPPGISRTLNSDRMIGRTKPPCSGNGQEDGQSPEKPAVPPQAHYGQQQKQSPDETNCSTVAHPAFGLARSEDVPIGRDQEEASNAVCEQRLHCHNRMLSALAGPRRIDSTPDPHTCAFLLLKCCCRLLPRAPTSKNLPQAEGRGFGRKLPKPLSATTSSVMTGASPRSWATP